MLRTSPADTDEGMAGAVAWLRPRRACVLWGRWKSAPAVTVRDPTAASGRLTRWKSWTDGESPDGRQHVRRKCRWSVDPRLGRGARSPEFVREAQRTPKDEHLS